MASGADASKEIGEAEGVGVGVSSEKQQIGEASGLDGVIDEESGVSAKIKEAVGVEIRMLESQVTVEIGTDIGTALVNRVNDEEQAIGGEIGVSYVNQETEEVRVVVGVGEIGSCLVDQVNVEELAGGGEVGVSSANKESREVGGENGLDLVNQGTGKLDAGKIGGENEVASAECVSDEPGSVGCETGVSLLNQVNSKAKGIDDVIEVVSTDHVSEEGGGFGCESVTASATRVSGETQGIGGEIVAFSTDCASEEAGCIGGESFVGGDIEGTPMIHASEQGRGIGGTGVAFAIQVTGETKCIGGEIEEASMNHVTEEAGSIVTKNEVAYSYQVNEEVRSGGEAGMRSSSQVNGISEGVGDGIRVPCANQVNGEAGCVGGEFGVVEKHRWVETKVYRRRPKGEKNKGILNDLITIPSTETLIDGSRTQSEKVHLSEVNTRESNTIDEGNHWDNHVEGNGVPESDKVVSFKSSGDINNRRQIQPEITADVVSNMELFATGTDCLTRIPFDPRVTNGALNPLLSASDGKVKVNLTSTSKPERQQLKRKFESELYSVRKAVKKMDGGREDIVPEFYHPVVNSNFVPNGARSNGFATRIYSSTRSLGHVPYKPNIRPFNQLRVSVVENNHGMVDSIEREKRTPKANTFYKNSEFLLANDKFPQAESNKKSKSNGQRSSVGEFDFGGSSKVYKSCSTLLEKLMKHKHGWVFNAPVDVKALGLHDYFLFVKNPMDLGTVKARLIKYWYKSPMEFAEDVRLTFHNAMLYNPKGHDVHIMAETLLKIFEGKWPDIEVKYLRELRSTVDHDRGFPTPTSRITNPFQSQEVSFLETRVFSNSEAMPHSVNPKPRTLTPAPSFKAPALQKPKAKDVNKREMTYGEKQKLSTNLQGLPPEKLDGVIQIIKNRSTALSQNDDEIEVDIDSVDTETLWELDRYVSNWKKSLSKHRRKAELANQMRAEARLAAEKTTTTTKLVPPRESVTGYVNATLPPPPLQNDPAANARGSSSSSSSSSSGSSSSDSDSDSSSEESDGGRSTGT